MSMLTMYYVYPISISQLIINTNIIAEFDELIKITNRTIMLLHMLTISNIFNKIKRKIYLSYVVAQKLTFQFRTFVFTTTKCTHA